jgi:hypothetical protein
MKTLATPVSTAAAATQSAWTELYDFYLKSPITTPWGTLSVLRLTDNPGGLPFFTPKLSPEPAADQGDAATYRFWPLKRALVKGDAKFANDKMQLTASNVSTEWAAMVAAIDWYDTQVIIRKVPTTDPSALTADDCAILWTGQLDAARLTELQIVFEASNDLANLQTAAPRENMHTNCRFAWADDLCTTIRFRPTNYKTGTVAADSTTTLVKSTDLSEDSGSSATYGTDLVNALADGSIAASSEGGSGAVSNCTVDDYPIVLGGGLSILTVYTDSPPADYTLVSFSADTLPTGLVAGTWYTARRVTGYNAFIPYRSSGSLLPFVNAGVNVSFSTVTGSSTYAKRVKSSYGGFWAISDLTDWGTASQGFHLIPDAQIGTANPDLKPYIRFDFGSAVSPKLWRLSSVATSTLEDLVRLVQFSYYGDDSAYHFHRYFELPPVGGQLYDCLLPDAPSARYWRINVRSQWGAGFKPTLFNTVQAYTASRHYWAWGMLTFAANTTTVALRNISRRVRESYSGQAVVAALPVAPAAGDTFTIERGCPRTFNGCASRNNLENYGGFTDLPFQTIIR